MYIHIHNFKTCLRYDKEDEMSTSLTPFLLIEIKLL